MYILFSQSLVFYIITYAIFVNEHIYCKNPFFALIWQALLCNIDKNKSSLLYCLSIYYVSITNNSEVHLLKINIYFFLIGTWICIVKSFGICYYLKVVWQAAMAQEVERRLGKAEATGSNPVSSFIFFALMFI